MKYIGIYNASSTVTGEILYVLGKLFRQTECSLCDISHGLSLKAKTEWKHELSEFPYKFVALHTNEIPATIKAQLTEFPVVIAVDANDQFTVVMDKAEIKACNKDPKVFFNTLTSKIKKQ